jgi:hypothetical protein
MRKAFMKDQKKEALARLLNRVQHGDQEALQDLCKMLERDIRGKLSLDKSKRPVNWIDKN